jgi:hypothetical protein
VGRRVHVTAQLAGEIALAATLAVTLAISTRDSAPGERYVYPVAPIKSGIALMPVSGNNLYSGKLFQVHLPPPVPKPPPEPPIPTAPPVQLLIPTLDVHRAVEPIGVNGRGVLDMPVNAWNGGWYKGGPTPGAPGDAVIEGHAGYPDQPMIFGKLIKMARGDQIIVVLGDGSRQLFLVESMQTLPVGSAPPGMGEPYGPPRLTLLTCTGHFDKDHYSYSDRLVVEASYAGSA